MKAVEIIYGKYDTAYILKDKERNHWYVSTEFEGYVLNRFFSFEEAKRQALQYIGGYRKENKEMDYTEYVATVEVEVMGVRHSISIPYLEEEYDEDTLYDMAMEMIEEQICFMSSSIRPMESEVSYA